MHVQSQQQKQKKKMLNMFKTNNEVATPKRRGVLIVDFEHISHFFLVLVVIFDHISICFVEISPVV